LSVKQLKTAGLSENFDFSLNRSLSKALQLGSVLNFTHIDEFITLASDKIYPKVGVYALSKIYTLNAKNASVDNNKEGDQKELDSTYFENKYLPLFTPEHKTQVMRALWVATHTAFFLEVAKKINELDLTFDKQTATSQKMEELMIFVRESKLKFNKKVKSTLYKYHFSDDELQAIDQELLSTRVRRSNGKLQTLCAINIHLNSYIKPEQHLWVEKIILSAQTAAFDDSVIQPKKSYRI